MVNIERELETLRQSLLDLSLRNNLINYRFSKAKTIKIVDEHPREIYNILVLHEKTMNFFSTDKSDFDTNINFDKKWAPIIDETEEPNNYFDNYLNTPYEPVELEKRLSNVYNKAKLIFEEQGYSILYLALGILNWRESQNSDRDNKAPLVLIPVELNRPRVGRKFTLKCTGEDITTNITLQAKLAEQGIELPEFEMPEEKSGIDTYFKSIENAISKKKDWWISNEMYLDLFNFKKFIMYKDLDITTWPENSSPANHPLIEQIFNPSSNLENQPNFSVDDVDLKLSAKDTFHIMDADSSQIAVIEDVKAGKNLVVEGPPGTGKSQTITNIIAELLALGKSVLFVSEKMAALQVVKSRIDKAGLGELCLEIHSHKTNKKEVLAELERTLYRSSPKKINVDLEIHKLEHLKAELNEYANILHQHAGKRSVSLYDLYGLREKVRLHFLKNNRLMPRIKFSDPDKWDDGQWDKAIISLEKLTELLPSVRTILCNPWKDCEPGVLVNSDIEEINRLIDKILQSIIDLESLIKEMAIITGTNTPTSKSQLIPLVATAKVLTSTFQIDEGILKDPIWNSQNNDAEDLILELRKYQELDSIIREKFKNSILDTDISSYRSLSSSLLKFLNPKFKRIKREIQNCYNLKPPSDNDKILEDLRIVFDMKLANDNLKSLQPKGRKLFGAYWNDEKTDPRLLEDISNSIISIRHYVLKGILSEKAFQIVSNDYNKEGLKSIIKNIQQITDNLVAQQTSLYKLINPDIETIFGKNFDDITFEELKSKLNLWKFELSSLLMWTRFINQKKECSLTVAAPLIHLIDNDEITGEDLVYTFKGNYVDSLLKIIFTEKKILGEFCKELQDNRINKFKELDERIISQNRQRIIYEAFNYKPQLSYEASKESEAGILKTEFTRRRGHLPIRKLMTKVGGLIQKIKPCFMMSPLSIAQYLDPRTTRFDVIIFDEASQVRPQDAIGALLRGRQVIVMGDSKQLPPTNFFEHVIESEDVDDAEDYIDAESVLDLCKRSFKTKNLLWHYRSSHESLIAVSNSEFYDNRLYVYPSAMRDIEDIGLKFVYLPDTTYDRGKSSINIGEAQAVAKAVIEQYNRFPSKSIGVGTFNIKQERAIEDAIEALIHQDHVTYFKNEKEEPFFVKNIETIQGDERDVIFISVGFGFDSYHKLSQNFGPLNQEGGERRLNVLITRAREKCIVYSNFTAKDLKIDDKSPKSLRVFKMFLEYAETKKFVPISPPMEDCDSPFEESVYEFLKDNGYEVQKQVGCGPYRIDLAIVDQYNSGSYLIGIECDGALYHSSRVARDRDRLRQKILEKNGWKIYRVWSTDWYLSPIKSGNKLLEAIERTKLNKTIEKAPSEKSQEESQDEITDNEKINVIDHSTSQTEKVGKFKSSIPEYKVCLLSDTLMEDFSKLSESHLEQVILKIVNFEGPVHTEELILRIKMNFGIGRAGSNIKSRILNSIESARESKKIFIKEDFLWPDSKPDNILRKRCGTSPVKIEWICNEEIIQAIYFVLNNQYSTSLEDLIVETSRVLGIKVVRKNAKDVIENVIESLIQDNHLRKLPNNMIYYRERNI